MVAGPRCKSGDAHITAGQTRESSVKQEFPTPVTEASQPSCWVWAPTRMPTAPATSVKSFGVMKVFPIASRVGIVSRNGLIAWYTLRA